MKVLGVLGILLLLSGCCTQRFDLSGTRGTIPTYEGKSHFIFWGLGQTKDINPNEICGRRGVRSVDSHITFVDGLLSGITWGIYNPQSYSIYCNSER